MRGTNKNVLLLLISTKDASTDTLRISVTQTKSLAPPEGKALSCTRSRMHKEAHTAPLEPTFPPWRLGVVLLISNLGEKRAFEVSTCCPGPPPPDRESSPLSRTSP